MFAFFAVNGRRLSVFISVFAALLVSVAAVTAQGPVPQSAQVALGSGFAYQGQLKKSGTPVNGACLMTFSLWDAASGLNQVGGFQVINPVTVTNGLFTVLLNNADQFGPSAFNGQERWLELAIQCGTDPGYTVLSRQRLSAAPYALYALGNWGLNGNGGTNPNTNFVGTSDNAAFTLRVSNTAALRLLPNPNSPILLGGYSGNQVSGAYDGSTIGGGGSPIFGANIISGTDVTYSTIGGGENNRIVGYAGGGTIAGGNANIISGLNRTADNSVIAGGYNNTASGNYSTVSGGTSNTASADASTVSGGYTNTASGGYSTVSGGQSNKTIGTWTTVAGGEFNTAVLDYSSVGGGVFNSASGYGSVIPGGNGNTAAGAYAFAAGWNARALHDGSFVWADTANLINPNGIPISSTAPDQFIVRASGGITLYTNPTATIGAALAPGSGSWGVVSDRNAKMNFAVVDARAVLAALAAIPVETWNYKTQDATIRHMGPMAQDFYAAFGVGESDTTISTVDAQGVALAAIQGLNRIVQAQDVRIAALEARVNALEQQRASSAPAPQSGISVEVLFMAGMFGLNLVLGALVIVYARKMHPGD